MRRLILLALLANLLIGALLASCAAADPSEYGIKSAGATASTNQAGAHPDFTFDFELKREGPAGFLPATTRDITIELPPGLLGNPNAAHKCSAAQLVGTDLTDKSNKTGCPQDSQIGVTEVQLFNAGGLSGFLEPVFNMDSPGGDTVARLGLIADVLPVFIDLHLRSEGDYGATATIQGASSLIPLLSARTTTWGVPAAKSHDGQRITAYEAIENNGTPETPTGRRESGLAPAPFMVNPTRCGVPREVKVTATSYALPDRPAFKTAPMPPVTGCGALGFKPKLTLVPTSREAAEPTGLDADLTIPQDESPESLSTSQLRYAKVTLPEGVTIASGAANGLEACSEAQAGYGAPGASHCPDAAKIGSAEIDSPALSRTIDGAVYQRTPVKGSLFRVWLVADELGVHLKLPGEIHLDPNTGQISTVFEGTPQAEGIPQAPVREFKLHFFGGSRGPLAAPRACGTYLAQYEFRPWSGGPPAKESAPMTFNQGCDTGGFAPKLSAWPKSPVAGAFSPFTAELTRESGEQNLEGLEVVPPPGLLAKLAGVTVCDGAAAASGQCPSSSQVGSVAVASGPGPDPLWIPQPGKDPTAVYLSGPYKGAPYSLVVRVPAQVGPFDLGNVVSRAAIRVDPETARVSVTADPLPQILEGVPVSYREVQVEMDRPGFTLNPTSCKSMSVGATVTSDGGAVATPSSPFEVSGCSDLGFKPTLSLRLKGKTNRGAHPALRGVLKARAGDANIARAQVALPHSEFLDQAHIRTICTRVQFAAGRCPRGSVYGHARAFTPLLDLPLEGPVYLRSSNHQLPDLVVALKGQIEVDAVARIDSINGGIRTTFQAIPDAPLSKVVLTMQGGKKGLLVNSRNLCKAPSRAQVSLDAHSGKSASQSPLLQNDCTKADSGTR